MFAFIQSGDLSFLVKPVRFPVPAGVVFMSTKTSTQCSTKTCSGLSAETILQFAFEPHIIPLGTFSPHSDVSSRFLLLTSCIIVAFF